MNRKSRRWQMFLRLLLRASILRRPSTLPAVVAILVAAAAASAMLNLFVDSQRQLRREFRRFGANLVMEAKDGRPFAADDLRRIPSLVGGRGLAVPFAYVVARSEQDQPVVIAGTDFDLLARLNPWWSVSSWPRTSGEALIGRRAVRILAPSGDPFVLSYRGRRIRLSPAGVVETGAGEDSRVYISLAEFKSWTGLEPSIFEIAASGSPAELNSLLSGLEQAVGGADVHPVRQIAEGEANVLAKTHTTLVSSAILILSTMALAVGATLMGWVFDRRRDFAIMKALGASDGLIRLFLAAEAAVLATLGAILGFAAGMALAAWIGRVNFHSPVEPKLALFPPVLAGCLLVTLLASLLPARLLGQIQPARILRGE